MHYNVTNPRKPNYMTCQHCGHMFHIAPSLVAQGQGKHCSRVCYAASQATANYIHGATGYRVTTVGGTRDGEHRHVWRQANGPIPRGFVVHHRNEDKTDNRLDNLELMTRAEHARLHHC